MAGIATDAERIEGCDYNASTEDMLFIENLREAAFLGEDHTLFVHVEDTGNNSDNSARLDECVLERPENKKVLLDTFRVVAVRVSRPGQVLQKLYETSSNDSEGASTVMNATQSNPTERHFRSETDNSLNYEKSVGIFSCTSDASKDTRRRRRKRSYFFYEAKGMLHTVAVIRISNNALPTFCRPRAE